MMEYYIQKYQFHQDGRDFVVSTGLVGDRIRITCQESLSLEGPFYSNEFSLHDLRVANQFFNLTQTSEEALKEINKGIERQKSALKIGENDTIHFLGYVIIGTDNDVYDLLLRRDYNPNKYGIFTPPASGAADLVLTSNYQVDGSRLNSAEINTGDLQRDENYLEEELNLTIPEINKLKKMSIDIEEENALIRERLRILQRQLEEKKIKVLGLLEENSNLKRENQSLNNHIRNQENSIRDKQAYQASVKVPTKPNIVPGASAVTSKFEQSAVRTFLPRTGAKPTTEEYIQNNNYISPVATTLITPQPTLIYSVPTIYQTQPVQNIQPIYQQPQIITPQPVMLQVSQPLLNYTPNPPNILRATDRSNSSGFSNTTYRAYLNSSPKEPVYKNRVYDPNYSTRFGNKGKDAPYSSSSVKVNQNKDIPYSSRMARTNTDRDAPYSSSSVRDVPYSSQMARLNKNNDVPYSSQMARTNTNKDVPYSSQMARTNTNKDVPYSSQMARTNSNKDLPYSSQMARLNTNKDVPYSSQMARTNTNKDVPYSSQMANSSKIDGYSSKMGTMLNGSTTGYSSQMAKTQGNVNQGYTKPIGSRLPKQNYGNYNGYSSKKQGNKGPEIGYSSYRPDKK